MYIYIFIYSVQIGGIETFRPLEHILSEVLKHCKHKYCLNFDQNIQNI